MMPSLSKAKLLVDPAANKQEVQEFVYRVVEVAGPKDGNSPSHLPANTEMLWNESPVQDAPLESDGKYTEEDLEAREQQARQKGFEEGTAQARDNLGEALAAEREQLAAALNEFAKGREEYFRSVEGETVRLVLAVARKVLHREAQVDPLLLTGVVRVALEKIAKGTSLKLRVPAIYADDWHKALGSAPDRGSKVEIVGDRSLQGSQCLIVTHAGTTDISLEGQLAEIERGFLDLLSQRPGNGSDNLQSPSYAA